jgi:hypothetical protein
MLLKIRHRITLKLYLDSYLLLIGYSLYIVVSCPAGSYSPPPPPSQEQPSRKLFIYYSKLSQGSHPQKAILRELPPKELPTKELYRYYSKLFPREPFIYYSELPLGELSPTAPQGALY